MLAIKAENRHAPLRMLEVLPFNHVVLGLPQVTVLRPEKGREPQNRIRTLGMRPQFIGGMHEIRPDRSRVQNGANAGTSQGLGPEFGELIQRKLNKAFATFHRALTLPERVSGKGTSPARRRLAVPAPRRDRQGFGGHPFTERRAKNPSALFASEPALGPREKEVHHGLTQ